MEQPAYALRFSESERQRYRGMAARAAIDEAGLWTSAGIVPGARVADVGCGPGAVLVEIARITAEDGQAVGVEPDASAREAATEEVAAANVAARVVDGTATATGLTAGAFDVVMIRHVLFHLGRDAAAAIQHGLGLLRSGGHMYVVDVDLRERGMFASRVDPDVEDLSERYLKFQEDRGCDVTIGSRLRALLEGAGLDVTVAERLSSVVAGERLGGGGPMGAAIPAMIAAGIATSEDGLRWRAGLSRFASTPGAAVSVHMDIAVGTNVGR
jgi:SAM-dependent methyltransferase